MNVNFDLSTSGTFNVGTLAVSFYDLVEKFGYPEIQEYPDKVRVLWVLQDGNRVLTIYDWKQSCPVEDVEIWNVGGKSTLDWLAVAMEFKL